MKKFRKTVASIAAATLCAVMSIQQVNVSAAVIPSSVTQYNISQPSYISNFVRHEAMKFPTGTYWNSGNEDTYTRKACTHTSKVDFSTCTGFEVDEILNKGYKIPVNPPDYNGDAGNEYYQCFGFAFKLQSDLFDTRSFLKLYYSDLKKISSTKDKYEPRVGDHIRINNASHSIFVTAVNSTTITYADCNSGNNGCKIEWGKTMKISDLQKQSAHLYVFRPMMEGDANGDSVINSEDALFILNITAGNEAAPTFIYKKAAADVDKDGKITSSDALKVNQIIAGYKTNFGYLKESN